VIATVASSPVSRMSATVTAPAFHHDHTSTSVSVLKSVQSSKYPMRRRIVTER
jgi:hypothetical protein